MGELGVLLLASLTIFILMFASLALGVMLRRRALSGSCGGLGALGIDKACDCPEPCAARLQRQAEAERQRQRIL